MIDTLWGGANNPEINEALANWCAAQIGLPRPFAAPYVTMGVFSDGSLVAVILFNNYQPEAGVIEIHGAALKLGWLTRRIIREMAEYGFGQLGCQMAVMRVSEKNRQLNGRGARRALKAYGFEAYHIPRLRGRDEGEIIYTLTDDAWRSNGAYKVKEG